MVEKKLTEALLDDTPKPALSARNLKRTHQDVEVKINVSVEGSNKTTSLKQGVSPQS